MNPLNLFHPSKNLSINSWRKFFPNFDQGRPMNHLIKSLSKPLKIDIRNPCEHHIHGPITRTFTVPRTKLISLLSESHTHDIIDRIDITEYGDETHASVYTNRVDRPIIGEMRNVSSEIIEWDLEPQYSQGSANEIKE